MYISCTLEQPKTLSGFLHCIYLSKICVTVRIYDFRNKEGCTMRVHYRYTKPYHPKKTAANVSITLHSFWEFLDGARKVKQVYICSSTTRT